MRGLSAAFKTVPSSATATNVSHAASGPCLTYMSNRHKTLEELCIGQQIGGGHILAQASVKGASEDKSIRA